MIQHASINMEELFEKIERNEKQLNHEDLGFCLYDYNEELEIKIEQQETRKDDIYKVINKFESINSKSNTSSKDVLLEVFDVMNGISRADMKRYLDSRFIKM